MCTEDDKRKRLLFFFVFTSKNGEVLRMASVYKIVKCSIGESGSNI